MKDGSSGWAYLYVCNLGLLTVLVIAECIAAFPFGIALSIIII